MDAKKLRMEQWKSEPADIFAMRVWARVLPSLSPQEARAAAAWIWRVTDETKPKEGTHG